MNNTKLQLLIEHINDRNGQLEIGLVYIFKHWDCVESIKQRVLDSTDFELDVPTKEKLVQVATDIEFGLNLVLENKTEVNSKIVLFIENNLKIVKEILKV